MTFGHGLLLGIFGILLTIVGFMIAWIVYESHRKRIKRDREEKERQVPYDFR